MKDRKLLAVACLAVAAVGLLLVYTFDVVSYDSGVID
jgi:hypothetical protein